jgi:hypothetical protein
VRTTLRWGLAAVFLASALLKLADFDPTWAEMARNLELGDAAAQALVSALVLGEMALAGALLLAREGDRRVFGATAALMLVFLAASGWLALRGAESCGCFGARFAMSPAATAAKNAVMLAAALWLRRDPGSTPAQPRHLAAGGR